MHLALVGCTASGKSEVALEVARRLGGGRAGPPVEIVAIDSMQVYRGMDIGTAKPSAAERAEIPHHLLDLVDPGEDWSVVRFAQAARQALSGIEARGHRALLVGGTGLYFQAVVDGFEPPGRYPDARAAVELEGDVARLYRRLVDVDPTAAGRMEPTNRRRIVRALEVTLGSGQRYSTFGPGVAAYPATPWRLAGLWLPRPVVAARIASRLAGMVAAGLVDEVRALAARPGGLSRTARQALGYREILMHLEDGVELGPAIDMAVARTRAFARRQRVWWRRDPRLRWFGAAQNPFAVVPSLLGHWS